MADITLFDEFNRRRLARRNTPAPDGRAGAATPVDIAALTTKVLSADTRHDTIFLSQFDAPADHPALRPLHARPAYSFMTYIYNDDVTRVESLLTKISTTGAPSSAYWHFPGKADAHYLMPDHLVRSAAMARVLDRHGFTFDRQDDDGALPLHYIAQHATDPDLIVFLADHRELNMKTGGWYLNRSARPRCHYDAPIITAVKHSNLAAITGFARLAPDMVDVNTTERHLGYSPLMRAILLCEGLVHQIGASPSPQPDLKDLLKQRLKIVHTLAAMPGINLGIRTTMEFTAETLARSPQTRGALYSGLNRQPLHGIEFPSFHYAPD